VTQKLSSSIKILGIIGSPRKGGNTELLVQKALESAAKVGGVETDLIRLCEKKIAPCVDCKACIRNKTLCIIEDDMQEIYLKLIEADGIIIGSPVYFGTVSAQLKTVMDRTLPLHPMYAPRCAETGLKNKIGAAITVGDGKFGGQEEALDTIRNFMLNHGMIVVSGIPPEGHWQACGTAAEPGKISDDKYALESARGIGLRVANTAKNMKLAFHATEEVTRWMASSLAAAVAPILEKYGEDAKKVLRKAYYDLGSMYARYLLDEFKPKERSLKTRGQLASRLFLPFEFGGQKIERIELTKNRYVCRVHRCLWVEGFSRVVKERKTLCDLCGLQSYIDYGFAETVNKRMKYSKYDWGLAKGEPYCEFIIKYRHDNAGVRRSRRSNSGS